MTINFPSSPSNNQLFVAEGKAMRYVSSKGKWKQVSTLTSSQITDLEARTVGVSSMSISGNTLVIQKDDSSYANVSLASFAGNKLTSYANASILPLSDLVSGTQVYVEDTDSLYITDGSGWYKIATVNLSPSLTLGVESISLSSGGSVDVNYTVNEPEDTPYTVTASSTSNTTITVYQANSTITFSAPVQNSTETITISATDGVNSVGDTLTMTILFTVDWSTGSQQANIPTNVTSGAPMFGYSLDLDNNGDTMIAGAKGDTTQANDSAGNNKGTVSIYTRSGSTWSRQQKITNPYNSQASDLFGTSSAISGDGNTVVVGTPYFYDSNTSTSTGIASLYTKSGSTWSLSNTLKSGNTQNDQDYGWTVDVDNDATRIVVAAKKFNHPSKSGAGCGFVYKNTGSGYTQEAQIFANDYGSIGNNPEMFYSVAINSTGDTIVAGGAPASANGTGSGVAYIFTRSGTTWSQQAKIMPAAVTSGDDYGHDVDISDDGNTVIVGAIYDDDRGSNAGAAYVWTRSGSTWTEAATLTASDGESNALFGHGVAISGNGSIVAVGANKHNGATGKAYIYNSNTVGYNIVTGSYTQASPAFTSVETGFTSFLFNDDGTKLYILGYQNYTWKRYSLSAAYDISTASYDGAGFDRSNTGAMQNPGEVRWGDSGTKLYILDTTDNWIYQMNLSTAYDITTASHWTYLSSGLLNLSEGFDLSPDGTKLIYCSRTYVRELTLGTAWDISTASYASREYLFQNNLANPVASARSITWNDDGTKFFVSCVTNDKIYRYSVSNPYQVTGVSYDGVELDISGYSGQAAMISFENAGSGYAGGKLFVSDPTADKLFEYSVTGVNYFEEKILTASDAASSSEFGWQTALNQNGDTCAVSAIETNVGSSTQAGSAYVFTTS